MKFNEVLDDAFFDVLKEIASGDVLEEASKRTLEKKKQKRKERKRKEAKEIDPDARYEITPAANAVKKAHRTFDWEDDNPKFRDGRERLITAVIHIVQKNGGSLGRQEAREYLYKKYKQWKSKSPKVQWILELEAKAIPLGFNPRNYQDQKPGQSSGKNKKEYYGRALFFTGVMNGFANHFLKKQGLTMGHKQAHMEKPTDKEKEQIKKNENKRIWDLFHKKGK